MGYQYDVFLSYRRKHPYGKWVDEIFYPLFVPYLEEAANKDISIFKDTEEIEAGSAWPQRIRNALANSRCMVSILIPSYFRSEWCLKEFAVMDYRQKRLGYLTDQKPEGLIVPIKLFDGEHFPEDVQQIQMLDCREFLRAEEGVKKAQLFLDLDGVLQKWVYDVAAAMARAPEWDAAWLSDEWLDIPANKGFIQPGIKPVVRKPTL